MQSLPPVDEQTVRMHWEGISDHGLRLFLMDLTMSQDRIIMAYGSRPVAVAAYHISSMQVSNGQLKMVAVGEGEQLSVDVRGEAFIGTSFPSGKLEGTVTLTPLAAPKYASEFPVVFFGWGREGFTAALQALREAADQKAKEPKGEPGQSSGTRLAPTK